MNDDLILRSLVAWLASAIGIVGISLARLALNKRKDRIYLILCLWTIGIMLMIEFAMNSTMTVYGSIVPSLVAAIASLAFVWLGLGRLWPGDSPIGFNNNNVLRTLVIGILTGLILSSAVSGIWRKSGDLPSFFLILLISSNTVTKSIIEEAVFRGRVMQILARFHSNPEVVLFVQAGIFAVTHVIGAVIYYRTSGGHTDLVSLFSMTLVMGYAFGLLRLKTGSLWAPLSAHITYNTLFYAALSRS